VPALSPDELPLPRLSALCPRALALAVTDERPVSSPDRADTERHVRQTLEQVLHSGGIDVDANATHACEVRIRVPASDELGMPRQWCIELAASFTLWGTIEVPSSAYSCAGTSSADGVLLGPRLSHAFEGALTTLLHAWESQLGGPVDCFDHPRFEASQVRMPRFAEVQPRVVGLEVVDEWDVSGAAGRSLRQALETAFMNADLAIDDHAVSRLTVMVRHPEKTASRTHLLCVEIAMHARFSTMERSARAVECRGVQRRPIEHDALNATLQILDEAR
jgi:hypothetical protein